MNVIGDQRSVEGDTEPLPRAEEEEVEQDVEDVLGQHQRVEAGALIYRILVICLQLIECDDLQRKLVRNVVFKIPFVGVEQG